jgi:DNA-binding LytR/AlgR family response regulator
MKISCIIIDDEPSSLHLLEGYVRQTPSLHLKGKFFDALEALEFIRHQKVDLIITDINMPLLTGLELADILAREQKFIFATAYAEHALTSFSYHVVDYLLKPITFKRFTQAIMKIDSSTQEKADGAENDSTAFMFVKSGRQMIRINFKDVLYIKGVKEYVCIQLLKEKVLVYKRMKDMETLLPSYFVRAHVSYIINSRYINKVLTNQVLVNNEAIPVSAGYKREFLQFLNVFKRKSP